MSKIQRICGWCSKEFFAEKREVKRGGGKFCSLSCGTKNQNHYKEEISKTCSYCKLIYKTVSKHSLYCTIRCAQSARKERDVKSGIKYNHRSALQRKVIGKIGPLEFKCFICNWNEANCDIHHIKSRASKGTDSFDNLSVLCPNCHRLADRGKLISIPSVSERYRTISSS